MIVPGPLKVEVDLYGPYTVDLATLIPGVSRAPGARTVSFSAQDVAEAYRLVQLLTQLAQIKPS
jgi:D-amino peptidase